MMHAEDYYRLYFGNQADYYLEVAKQFYLGKRVVFNLYSFLFGFLWMLYRKMFLPFLFFGILSSVTATLSKGKLVDLVLILAWAVIYGAVGNRLYIIQADRQITKILAMSLTEEDKLIRIQRAGGTTLVPHLFIVTILVFYLVLG